MPHNEGKQSRSLPPDVLSNLPDNVIDVILMCAPCKDAVRTSILSKKWRYHWYRLTKLELDESLWRTPKDLLYPTVKFTKIIYHFLTHHEGPITKFELSITHLKRCPEIDSFVYYLSRNGIQNLVLHFTRYDLYELPSSLFACSQLRHLSLHFCIIRSPTTFQGFDRLISLELCLVTVSSELLESLISHCPLLELLVLDISEPLNSIEINAPMLRSLDFTGNITSVCLKNVPLLAKASLIDSGYPLEAENFDYVKLFQSCSALEHLILKVRSSKFFADQAPTRLETRKRLPFDLNCVRRCCLSGIILMESCNLSCALCLIRSCPYLEYLKIEVMNEDDVGVQESLELDHFSDVTFNHLREVQLLDFERTMPGMQLIKLLLAKSPVLVKMQIYPYIHDQGSRSEILTDVSKFWHASPKAEVVYKP